MVLVRLVEAHHMAENRHLTVVEDMELVGMVLALLHQARRMAEEMNFGVGEGTVIVGMALALLRHMADYIHMVAEVDMEVAEEEELRMVVDAEGMGYATMVEVGDIVDKVEVNDSDEMKSWAAGRVRVRRKAGNSDMT